MFVWQTLVATPVDQLVAAAVLQPGQRLLVDSWAAAPLVADRLAAFDADQRRRVAERAQAPGGVSSVEEVAVGEEQEVAVGMGREDVEQPRVQERLAAQDAEEAVAVLLRFEDRRG